MPNSTCSIHDCEKPTRTRGWCLGHYKRWLKTGDPLPATKPTRICDFPGCGRKHAAYGLCSAHDKQRKQGDALRPIRRKMDSAASTSERLAGTHTVNPLTGCWEWTLYVNPCGYGEIRVNGTLYPAHRLSYEHRVGPIPQGMHMDHVCGVRRCVNPAHLRPVTNKQNSEHKTQLLSNNSSGFLGVCFSTEKQKWRAYVNHNGKQNHVGYFDTKAEAAEAARLKRLELFTHNDRDRAA